MACLLVEEAGSPAVSKGTSSGMVPAFQQIKGLQTCVETFH